MSTAASSTRSPDGETWNNWQILVAVVIHPFQDTFDLVADPDSGRTISGTERMRQMPEMVEIAYESGLDIIGVGEHHGLNFVNSATATSIAAMAARTRRIRLTSCARR